MAGGQTKPTDVESRLLEHASHGAASLINAENDTRSATPSAADAQAEPQRPVRVVVSELLAGGREAILVHDGQDYRLRITANGKLILTK